MIEANDVARLYGEGLTQKEVAVRLGCHVTSVIRLMKSLGFRVRPKSRTYALNESFFEIIDSEEKAYWLGFALADGSIKRNVKYGTPCALVIGLNSEDHNHLEALKTTIGYEGPVKTINYFDKRYRKWYERSQLEPTSKKLCFDLLDKGWDQFKKTGDVRILEEISKALRPALIRGLVDGDGSLFLRVDGLKTSSFFHFTDLHRSVVEWVSVNLNIKSPLAYRNWKKKGFSIKVNQLQLVKSVVSYLYDNDGPSLSRKKKIAVKLMNVVPASLDVRRLRTPHARLFTIKETTDTMSGWCRRSGINPSTFHSRIKSGWTEEQALTTQRLAVSGLSNADRRVRRGVIP